MKNSLETTLGNLVIFGIRSVISYTFAPFINWYWHQVWDFSGLFAILSELWRIRSSKMRPLAINKEENLHPLSSNARAHRFKNSAYISCLTSAVLARLWSYIVNIYFFYFNGLNFLVIVSLKFSEFRIRFDNCWNWRQILTSAKIEH